ncbi:MAG: UDP-N-acetylmuramoyl-L-alanyl-D-glutamate--2,6-diaminopimelate ligase [Lachnospiraceae bacterium]|nr:UDP-N-acetylmuramoyl-L-alanyl-D-glutamate--2,6-diaminopimelate ligase [Lachnospiraceae bacterium]
MYGIDSLLERIDYSIILGSPSEKVSEVVVDSRKITKDCLFICITGFKVDAHSFAEQVIKDGAKALVVEKDLSETAMDLAREKGVTIIKVDDCRYAMAFISAAFYGYPADSLKVIGITGTKGKTTTTYLVKSALESSGLKVGLVGTIETIIGDEHIPASNTTPESFVLQGYFKRMLDAGITHVVMEVASQGLKLHRTQGFTFELGIFTNLSPDHIGPNEHESFEDYVECKGRLFKQCRCGIVNVDDDNLLKVIKGHTCDLRTFGFNKEADIYADNLKLVKEPGELGIEFDIFGDVKAHVSVPTPGAFSAHNALCAISICHYFNIPVDVMIGSLKNAHVKGRIEMVKTPYSFTMLIDYAHNAMSLESLLTSLREYEPKRLIVLFGCGGNRSRDRRLGMGEVAGRLADLSIITSDNPRDEDPQAIINDIKEGLLPTKGKYVEIINRKEAIRYAIENGKKNDIIVLAGKGHEDYQEIKGVKYPMDERVIIKEILNELR